MLGLLAVTQTACSSDSEEPNTVESKGDVDSTGSGDENPSQGGQQAQAEGEGSSNETGTGGSAGSTDGMGGTQAPVEGVLSTKTIPDLSLADFTEMCDEAGGQVETHATCGGVVSGKGFSYDDATYAFTEHTCAGYNTCSGFSCVLDD